MSWLMRAALNFARAALIIVFIVLNWSLFSAIIQGKVSWNEAINALFSNVGILLLGLAIIATLLISFLRLTIVKWVVNVGTVLVILALFTGAIKVNDLQNMVNAYVNNDAIRTAVAPCNWYPTVEKVGEQIRSVLANKQGETIGYATYDNGNTVITDTAGKILTCSPAK